jgi:hypothetical protein
VRAKLALLGLLAVLGCGGREPQLQFDFVLSALLADQISELQVSIVSKGRSLGGGDCVAVQATCLWPTQVSIDRFIPVQDSSGVEHKALRFPLSLKAAGANSSQDVTVQGIPVGKDYGLVIEALSKDNPPKLAGSSCNYLQEIVAGANPKQLAIAIRPLTPPVNCDPRVEK